MEFNIGKTSDGNAFSLDPKLLLKHGVVLGATGSGKTVMCKNLIEEAAKNGIPTLAIDPKGDIGGLALAFPDLNFRPWSDVEAESLGVGPDEYSEQLAQNYTTALAENGMSTEDITGFAAATEVRIYTPKSTTGLEVSLSPQLDPPPGFSEMMMEDPTLSLDMVESTILSLLKLVGYDEGAKKELSFLSQCLLGEWDKGSSPDIGTLINLAMNPPFEEMGSLTVDQFISEKERADLASKLNLILTHPGLKAWFVGEPLDFDTIFARGEKTPVTVMDLRWISEESERQFFVGMLTQELYKWLLKQGGTQSLRYILYFDEIAGYLPSDPKNPPSKKGLRLLVKQARAFGLGCIFATQNPGDIDYMMLSNINNRFVGNLKSKRDVEKVALGMDMPVTDLANQLSTLKTLQFFFHNPDRGQPSFIRPRWLMTYHRGPLNPDEIKLLSAPFEEAKAQAAAAEPTETKHTTKKAVSLPGLEESLLDTGVTANGLLATYPLNVDVPGAKQVTVTAVPMLAANLSCTVEKKLPGITMPFEEERTWAVRADLTSSSPEVLFEVVEGQEYGGASFADGMRAIASGTEHALERAEPQADHKQLLRDAQQQAAQEMSGTLFYASQTNEVSKDDPEPVKRSLMDHFALDREGKTSKVDEKLARTEEDIAFKKEKAQGDIQRFRTDIASVEGEIKDLEGQVNAKKKEKKPTTQLTTGISSRKRKIPDLNAKIKAAQKTISMLDQRKERESGALTRERELLEKKFAQTIEREVKTIELRVDAGDVQVSDARVVWVPRTVTVDGDVVYRHGEREVSVAYDTESRLGSAGSCEASGCTTDLTTEAIGEVCVEGGEQLCTEHALPCDVCQVPLCAQHGVPCKVSGCPKVVCPEHEGAQRCKICQAVSCTEHATSCTVCGETLCPDHAIACAACNEVVCKEDTWACPQCDRTIGSDHQEIPCTKCGMGTCPVCTESCAVCSQPFCQEHLAPCAVEGCVKKVCSDHAEEQQCSHCAKTYCPDHLHPCPSCGKTVCDECSVTLRRDLVKTEERCKNCTTEEMIAEASTKNMKIMAALAVVVIVLLAVVYYLQGGV